MSAVAPTTWLTANIRFSGSRETAEKIVTLSLKRIGND
jgi:hypothetical protein